MKKSIYEIDLHGLNMVESKTILDEVFEHVLHKKSYGGLHIVVGVGRRSETGPVLPSFVLNYLKSKGFEGEVREGSIEVKLV
jgi:DNA-nicking Smr family endonuclease